MFPTRDIDLNFFDNAKYIFPAEVDLECTPERLFEIFEDAHAWTVWAPAIKKVEWTSPQPFGLGTTRTVFMAGKMEGYEEFIAWERGKHMAFKFVGCNKKSIEAFGEDYQVTDLGNGRCHMRWIMAMEPAGFSKIMLAIIKPFMAKSVQSMANNLADYVKQNP
ncbi:MAG: SRPBCC family protein [Pseudomonadales bacterium]